MTFQECVYCPDIYIKGTPALIQVADVKLPSHVCGKVRVLEGA